MPYKDKEEKAAYHRAYNLRMSIEQKEKKKAKQAEWWSSSYGKFSRQRYDAEKRGIGWQLSFEEWFGFWQSSGHWEERSATGYVMCRKGDEGPYAIDNIYIAPASVNKSDAWYNNKIKLPNTQLKYEDLCNS